MTNEARRVKLFKIEQFCEGRRVGIEEMVMDNPNGTHHLTPVDGFEVVKKEVWELAVETIRFNHAFNCHCSGMEPRCRSCRALAEIGGE